MNKPVILFTNFWDANKLLNRRYFLFRDEDKLYKVQFNAGKYKIYSIALSQPPIDRMPNIKTEFSNLERLNFFCPTYDMLKNYKEGGSWKDYILKFRGLMKQRREEIVDWIKSLIPGRLYILCCWENTSKGAHCHRQLIYRAMLKSKTLSKKAIYTYRNGSWDDTSPAALSFCGHVDDVLHQSQTQQVPVFVGDQDMANQLSIPINSQIGFGTYSANGTWSMNVSGSETTLDDLFNLIMSETNVSMACGVETDDPPF